MPKLLEPAESPECLKYLWQWFCDLNGGRGYSEAGPMALTYSEIQAWAQLTCSGPAAWEVGVLKQIDRAYLTEAMKK
jgi:hypothetical protein